MREYMGPGGETRLWFNPSEIEDMMEDELRSSELYPTKDRPVVDIEAFLERYLKIKLDQYADLDPDVLGVTQFSRFDIPRVLINKDLTGAAVDQEEGFAGLLGRWRATLAHEAAHVLMHRVLFEVSPLQGLLFSETVGNDDLGSGSMRCLKRDVSFTPGQSNWREVQANKGMAALLMPKKVFEDVFKELRSERKFSEGVGTKRRRLIRVAPPIASDIAQRFEVSYTAAAIRIKTLGLVGQQGQVQLGVTE